MLSIVAMQVTRKTTSNCIVKLFKKYISMVSELSRHNDAFYFRPSKICYKFEDVPVGIHKLNSPFCLL